MSKRLPELDRITAIDSTCLFLVNEPSEAANGNDRAINKTDLVKSIGSPGVQGFTAVESVANKLTLTASNNANVDTYYEGMIISFRSPIDSDLNTIVEVKIGNLPYKQLLESDDTGTELEEDAYYEFYYYTDNAVGSFYRKNIPNSIVYTPDYKCVGVISNDETSTTYNLTTAFGTPKTVLYECMSVYFTPDIDSKGVVYLNIDGIGNKTLVDSADDPVPNAVKALDYMNATYDGVKFIKNRFDQGAPEVPPIPEAAYDEVDVEQLDPDNGEIIEVPEIVIVPANVPAVNKTEVTVAPGGQFTTIRAAIQGLINDFGPTGSNKLCTITLASNFVWTERLYIQKGETLSWITINAPDQVKMQGNVTHFYQNYSLQPPIISGNYRQIGSDFRPIVYMDNAFANFTNFNLIIDNDRGFCWANGSVIKLNNVTVLGGAFVIGRTTSGASTGTSESIDLEINNSTFTNQKIAGVSAAKSRISILNTTFNSTANTFYIINTTSNLYLKDNEVIPPDYVINMNNCEITSASNPIYLFGMRANLINCTVRRSSGNGVLANERSDVTISGGDYRASSTTATTDIVSTRYSIITLKNSPIGGTSTSGGGTIINA